MLSLSLERHVRSLGKRDTAIAQEIPGALRDQDCVPRLTGRCLDAGGGVDGIADHAELKSPRAPDIPGHNGSGVEADPDLELALELLRYRALDLERRRERLVGVIGLAPRRAEYGEQAIADELIDVAIVRM